MTILWVIRRGGIYAARCSHPDKSTQWVNGTGRIYASPTNLPKICNLPSKFIDRPNPLKHSVSAGFPFCFPLPHPALPQSARRAAVRSSFLLPDSFPVCIAALLTGALCPLAAQPAFPHTPLFFAQRTPPALFPSVSVPEAFWQCVWLFSLLLVKQAAQRLPAAFARIPRSPLPCR